MITAQPILYTTDTAWWRRLADALGLVRATQDDEIWTEWDGDGIFAIHGVADDDPLVDTTELHFLVDDLEATRTALEGTGNSVEATELEDIGTLLRTQPSPGVTLSFTGGAREARGGYLAVQPIWYLPTPETGAAVLEAVGLSRRLSSDSGSWIDLTAPGGGLVATHDAADMSVVLGFEYRGDMDALADALGGAGFDARVVDEAYNRTLRIATPAGTDLWINGVIADTYGYSLAPGATLP